MYFHSNLRHLRKEKKLKQTELGEIIGVSGNSVTGYEKGNSFPKLDTLLKICSFFDVNIDDLIHQDLTKASARPATTGGEELQSKVNDLLEKRVRELEREIKRRDEGWARELGIE